LAIWLTEVAADEWADRICNGQRQSTPRVDEELKFRVGWVEVGHFLFPVKEKLMRDGARRETPVLLE
jgi:hypothetical protein